MIGLLSHPIAQNSVTRAFSNFYSNKKIDQISNIQKIVRNGHIVIDTLKIQFWTRFFWTTWYKASDFFKVRGVRLAKFLFKRELSSRGVGAFSYGG